MDYGEEGAGCYLGPRRLLLFMWPEIPRPYLSRKTGAFCLSLHRERHLNNRHDSSIIARFLALAVPVTWTPTRQTLLCNLSPKAAHRHEQATRKLPYGCPETRFPVPLTHPVSPGSQIRILSRFSANSTMATYRAE